MDLEIRHQSAAMLSEYAGIPIAFQVTEVFDVTSAPNGQFRLVARRLAEPYLKNYDAVSEAPGEWPQHFDTSHWVFLSAFEEGRRVGGATAACHSPDLQMLEGRVDLAVLWDIRVAPSSRRRGVGSRLFAAAMEWATSRGCRELKIETQNINVPACRFYARQGCVLRAVHPGAYRELPGEVQLLWYRDLGPEVVAG